MIERVAASVGAVFLPLWRDAFAIPSLFVEIVFGLFTHRPRREQWAHQLYQMGNLSFNTVIFTIAFTGMVLITEYAYHMKIVLQTDSLVPAFSAVMIIREIGPAVTALLLVSKIGAGITAEIGSMKITEQIEALRLLSVDPIVFLAIPRFVASIIATLCLCMMAIAVCLMTGMAVAVFSLGFEWGEVSNSLLQFVTLDDFFTTAAKAVTFGAIIPVVCCHYGFQTEAGAEGVGRATTNAVVTTVILVIISDFILTYLFSHVL